MPGGASTVLYRAAVYVTITNVTAANTYQRVTKYLSPIGETTQPLVDGRVLSNNSGTKGYLEVTSRAASSFTDPVSCSLINAGTSDIDGEGGATAVSIGTISAYLKALYRSGQFNVTGGNRYIFAGSGPVSPNIRFISAFLVGIAEENVPPVVNFFGTRILPLPSPNRIFPIDKVEEIRTFPLPTSQEGSLNQHLYQIPVDLLIQRCLVDPLICSNASGSTECGPGALVSILNLPSGGIEISLFPEGEVSNSVAPIATLSCRTSK